ncbi:hypothetical protein KCTC52924_02990 [Arenibacter antarcticus]|uniref:FecR family protein n=1 Tax=Arenibacter antarcticus TaxID=2040469 RepID=A0ABW5VFM8_9FLAO|nr:FecR domain-containing protein [Arenibacter sp. H213]MCM4166078.1 hypothetical protein [Arenibacter sp. H213]
MVRPEVEQLIINYLSKNATAADLDELSDWILLEGNQELFDDYVQSHLKLNTILNVPDTDRIKKALIRRIKRDKKVKMLRTFMKYAAVTVLVLLLSYTLQVQFFAKSDSELLQPKQEDITITLGNGKVETLSVNEDKIVKDADGNVIGTQENSKLVYTGTSKTEVLVYNTVNVPYGKQFDLVLSDGTQVFLNSGTSIRYPVAFLVGMERSVFLTGEAYFEVSEDKKHPFVVHADEMEIQVLGTKFNVSHYPENDYIDTVLVEGSVALQTEGNPTADTVLTRLEPGSKAEWHKSGRGMSVKNVDTRLYTAWTQGRLVFRNTAFKKIRHALERHYNVAIVNNDHSLDEQLFDATFDIETIDEVLSSFSKSYALAYSIEKNRIVIN